jgi:hypothetical protein
VAQGNAGEGLEGPRLEAAAPPGLEESEAVRPPARPKQVGKVSWGSTPTRFNRAEPEEKAYVKALHLEHPDWSWADLNRARFRKYPIDRVHTSIRNWCTA